MNWWVFASLLLAGTAAAHVFPEGKTFEYEYRMVALNGIPELDQQFAVHGLKCNVQLHSVNGQKLLMQMKNIQTAKENKIFQEISPEKIDLQLSNNAAYNNLTKPFIVEYQPDGTIKELGFYPSDPQWSRHLKMGLATMIQIKKLNSVVETNQINRGDDNDDIGTVTQQMEPTPSGLCNSIYSYQLLSKKSSQEEQEMIIDKVRDSHDCIHKPYFATSTMRRFKCNDCEKDDSHPVHQNDVCKYNVTLGGSDSYVIQQAICDGIVKVKPFGAEADALTLIHNRTLQLTRIKPIEESAHASLTNFDWETEKPYSNLTDKLVNIRNPESLDEPVVFQELCQDCDSLKEQSRRLLREYIQQIKGEHISIAESKNILDLIPPIQRGLVTLNYQELSELAREFNNDKVSKETFFEFVALAATNPCIKLIMESHKSNQITPEQTTKLLTTAAGHVYNPNTLLCDKLLEFCMSSQVQNHEQLSVTCYLSLGSIIAKSVAKDQYQIPRTSATLYPTEKRQQYIRALEQKLENTDDDLQQAALLVALGNTALDEAIPVIEKYVRASSDVPKVVQVKAIYALLPICKMSPEACRDTLISVLFNAGENTKARIAAFSVLIASRPRRHLYEKIATMTQYGNDQVLNTFIYSSFQALANATQPCLADASSHAQHALDLMSEEYDTSAWIASNTIVEGEMEHLDADAFLRFATVGDAGSMTPSTLYLQLQNLVANSPSNIFSFAMSGNNTSYLVDTLIGAQAIFEDRSWTESIQALNRPLKSLGLRNIAEQVEFMKRNQPKFSALISTRFMDFQQRLRKVDKETLQKILRAVGQENINLNFDVKTTKMPVDARLFMHVDSGYLYRVNIQTPIHMSLKGEIKVDPQSSAKSMNIDIDAKVKVNVATRAIIGAQVLIPDNEMTSVGTGFETTAIAAPLIAGKISIELQQQKLQIKCKAADSSSRGEFEAVHYHTKPFTAISKFFELNKLSAVAKTIHNEQEPSRKQVPILGNSLVLKLEDEQYWDSTANVYKYLEENSPLGIVVNGWMAQQWTPREYSLVWKKSQLPELSYEMEWEYKPAPADPQQHIDGFGYVLWREVFGLSDMPMRCQNSEGSQDTSASREESSSRQNSESAQADSSESLSFGHFQHSVDTEGRWMGWNFGHDSSSSKYETSKEAASPRWSKGWMGQSKEDNDYSGEYKGQSYGKSRDSSSKSKENSKSSEEFAGRFHANSEGSRGQLKIEQADMNEGVAVYIVRAEAKVKSDSEKGVKVELIVKKPRSKPQTSIDVLVKTTGSMERKMVCLKVKYTGQRPPCRLSKRLPELSEANMKLNASLSWGRACNEPEGYVDLNLKAKNSREQLRMPKSDRPYFYDQCKSDREDGNELSVACMEKLIHESRLNHVSAVIKYRGISPKVQNSSIHLLTFIKYAGYAHLSEDGVTQNPSSQIKLSANFQPNIPVVDLKLEHPTETLRFNKIFYGNVEPLVGPPSIFRSYARRVLNYYSDNLVTPSCVVSKKFINTLQNNTIQFDGRDTCQYLVTGDCSSDMFYVLLNNSQGSRDTSKTLTVHLLGNVIEINAQQRQVRINQQQVNMNDETITFLKDESYGPTLLGYVIKADGLYKVIMPFNRVSVSFDGENVVVRTSNLWRNKLCGICQENNPEEKETYTGPRKCSYSEGNDFAESYSVRDGQCQRQRPKGEVECDFSEGSFRHIQSHGYCSVHRPIVKAVGQQKMCGSLKPYKSCKSGCQATETERLNVPFICVNRRDEQAMQKLQDEAKWLKFTEQESVEELSIDVEVPVTCAPRQ